MASRDDLCGVELREVGKVVNLRVHETEERAELLGSNERPVRAEILLEHLGGRAGRGHDELFALLDLFDDGVANHLTEKLFLIGEVEVDRALGEASSLRDVVETGRREPALSEHGQRSFENLPGPLFGESAPAWFSGAGVFGTGHGDRRRNILLTGQ